MAGWGCQYDGWVHTSSSEALRLGSLLLLAPPPEDGASVWSDSSLCFFAGFTSMASSWSARCALGQELSDSVLELSLLLSLASRQHTT